MPGWLDLLGNLPGDHELKSFTLGHYISRSSWEWVNKTKLSSGFVEWGLRASLTFVSDSTTSYKHLPQRAPTP